MMMSASSEPCDLRLLPSLLVMARSEPSFCRLVSPDLPHDRERRTIDPGPARSKNLLAPDRCSPDRTSRLPHLKLIDGARRHVVSSDEPRLLGVPSGSRGLRPSLPGRTGNHYILGQGSCRQDPSRKVLRLGRCVIAASLHAALRRHCLTPTGRPGGRDRYAASRSAFGASQKNELRHTYELEDDL